MTGVPAIKNPPAINAPPGVRALVLAGSVRTARTVSISRALGIPPAALPLDAQTSLLAYWTDRLIEAGVTGAIGVAVADPEDLPFYQRVADEPLAQGRLAVWRDRNQHRGAGGTVRDYADDALAAGDSLLVVECASVADIDLAGFLRSLGPEGAASVAASPTLRPCGALHLSAAAIARIPSVGYYDLKEQLLPSLAAAGLKVSAWSAGAEPHRITDLGSYLALVFARAARGAALVSGDSAIDPAARLVGRVLAARGTSVGAGAIVSDSVLMQGAVVGTGAVVARSVVPPGASVPAGELVVDRVFAPLGPSDREAA